MVPAFLVQFTSNTKQNMQNKRKQQPEQEIQYAVRGWQSIPFVMVQTLDVFAWMNNISDWELHKKSMGCPLHGYHAQPRSRCHTWIYTTDRYTTDRSERGSSTPGRMYHDGIWSTKISWPIIPFESKITYVDWRHHFNMHSGNNVHLAIKELLALKIYHCNPGWRQGVCTH